MSGTVVATRNLFVNTDNVLQGECRDVTLNLPQGLIMCNENQRMRITLNSFAMRNSWYRVNKFNNTFYVVALTSANAVIKAKIVIPPGNYTSFDGTNGLGPAIKAAMDTALTTSPFILAATPTKVEWDAVTNIFTIELTTTGGSGAPTLSSVKLVTFTINNYRATAGSLIQTIIGNDLDAAFNNNFELMGGCYEKRDVLEGTVVEQYNELASMYSSAYASPKYTFEGAYNATLETEENIYLRTSLHSSSFQTAGFDSGSTLYPNVISSQILAKIPLNNPVFAYVKGGDDEYKYQRPYEVVFFQDNGNNMYSLLLKSKKISTLRLFVTDSYGRLIPEISATQIACDAMAFTCSLRVDVFENTVV